MIHLHLHWQFEKCMLILLASMCTISLAFLTSVRPSIRLSEGDSDDIAVTKGGDVTLQCAAEGVPQPAVTWLKDGRPITGQHGAKVLNEGRLLQIKDAKVSDTGRYTCIAVNVAGQTDSKHDISVHGMESQMFYTTFFFAYLFCCCLQVGESQHLKFSFCSVNSLSSPTKYNWSSGGARKCECCGEEPSCSELRGFRHPSSCHYLAEGRSSNQSFQLSTRPLGWVPVWPLMNPSYKTHKICNISTCFLSFFKRSLKADKICTWFSVQFMKKETKGEQASKNITELELFRFQLGFKSQAVAIHHQ